MSGEADLALAADRRMADSLGIRPPAALVGNRLRFDGLGPWNRGAFARALASGATGPDRGAAPEPGAARESGAP